MASFFENKDRNVIPNWRSFSVTAKLGETNTFHETPKVKKELNVDLSDLFDDWDQTKNIGIAGDILGSATVVNHPKTEKIIEISKFVIKNEHQASPQLITLAKNNFETLDLTKTTSLVDLDSIELFTGQSNLNSVYLKINGLKKQLERNPRNAIIWVELSRLYSILGQDLKAEKSIKSALHLASDNRFVLRSMVRFFAHINDIEFAHDVLRKSPITPNDSWLMASEISLSHMRGRGSKLMKKGIEIINSKNVLPFNISELASSIATSELHHGGFKKSKDFFKISLIQPNDNALAQAEWASQKENSLSIVNPSAFNLVNSYEALARDCFQKNLLNESIEFAIKWFLDMPFSKSPILFASHIAGSLLNNYDKAIEIAMAGLISHSKDNQILNNLIFFLCQKNRLEEANKYLEKANQNILDNPTDKTCLIATRGLYFFRKGFSDIGRSYYKEALELAVTTNNKYLFNLAFANYCREEVKINSEYAPDLIVKLDSILKGEFSRDILIIKDNILTIWNNRDQKSII